VICPHRSRATGTDSAVGILQPQKALVHTPQGFLLSRDSPCRHLRAAIVLAFAFSYGGLAQADKPCVITNETDSFAILSIQREANSSTSITWESCTNCIYGVLVADQPDTGAFWSGRSAMWGEDATTSWTDTTATNIDQRFYKVVRMPADGDFDSDRMPNAWELQYGLNLFDPNDAQTDSDGDNVDNLTEYLQGRDPTKGAVADSEKLVNLDVFTPLE
jgi:hypothetical protein